MTGVGEHIQVLGHDADHSRWDYEDESNWVSEIPGLPGCVADGDTPDEAVKSLGEAERLWTQAQLE